MPPKRNSQPKPKPTPRSQSSRKDTAKPESKHPVEIKREFPGLPKTRGAHCTVFRLSTGRELKIDDPDAATKYEKYKGDEIVETLAFDSPEEYSLYKSTVKSPRADVLTSSSTAAYGSFKSCLSPDQKKLFDKLKTHRNQNEPKPHILCVYQHTIFSKAVVMMMDFRDKAGRQVWNVKPVDHVRLLKSMENVAGDTFKGKFTREIIANMEPVPKRDLEGGPSKVLKSSGTYDTYVILTHFVLPDLDPQIDTMHRESEFIKTVAHTTLAELVTVMTSDLYRACYHDLTEEMSENYRGIVFSPKKGLDFSANIKRMNFHVNSLGDSHWTTYVVESKLHQIQSIISRHDGCAPKYIEDEAIINIPDTPDATEGKYAKGFNPSTQAAIKVTTVESNDEDDEEEESEEKSDEYDTAPEEPESNDEDLDKKPAAKPKKAAAKRASKTTASANKKPAAKRNRQPKPRKLVPKPPLNPHPKNVLQMPSIASRKHHLADSNSGSTHSVKF